ncbi:hypothetical protein UFOVP254_15 [uncultured Caudovirales phage]|uniref:Uncharacterized protein n=1 Tax=uncultured Caudovirales phage TaxID=2100421 RepID=A0A6J5KX14_9CAUD|nr:hypothetical protein UFOVP76_38 [uncultured Caudovirales phage]CAB4132914.1 hypothetical protein UFOVP254_15 [uncultured Caudovirales phage]
MKNWVCTFSGDMYEKGTGHCPDCGVTLVPLEQELSEAEKIAPPQRTWVGLTDEEIYSVLDNLQVMHHRPPTTDSRVIFALAIEAKLKEKNT